MAIFNLAMSNLTTSSPSEAHRDNRNRGENNNSNNSHRNSHSNHTGDEHTQSDHKLLAEAWSCQQLQNPLAQGDTALNALGRINVFTANEGFATEEPGSVSGLPVAACLIQELEAMPGFFGGGEKNTMKRRRVSQQQKTMKFADEDEYSSHSSTSGSSLSSAGVVAPVLATSSQEQKVQASSIQLLEHQILLSEPKPLERKASQGSKHHGQTQADRAASPSSQSSSSSSSSSAQSPKKTPGMASSAATNTPAGGEDSRFRNYQEGQWSERFNELVQFSKLMGHTNVPHNYPRNKPLARWVKRQRYQFRLLKEGQASTMTEKRIQTLEEIGFVWDCFGDTWKEKLEDLKAYKHVHGNCDVPCNYGVNPQLATWVKCQRRQYKLFVDGKASSITLDRIQTLESMGFRWGLRSSKKRKAQQEQEQQQQAAAAALPTAASSLFCNNLAAGSAMAMPFASTPNAFPAAAPSIRQAIQVQQQLHLQQVQQQQLLFSQASNIHPGSSQPDLMSADSIGMLDFRAI